MTARIPQKQPKTVPFAVLDNRAGYRVFVKAYERDIKAEFARGLLLFEAGQASGCFRAPEPLQLCEPHSLIIWEYVANLTGVRQALVDELSRPGNHDHAISEFFHRVGRILRTVHAEFRKLPPSGDSVAVSVDSGSSDLDDHVEQTLSEASCIALHGDFSCVNLFVPSGKLEEKITVVDPSPNPYLFRPAKPDLRASIYIDCAQFVYSVFAHRRLGRSLRGKMQDCVSRFIEGYTTDGGEGLDRATLYALAAWVSRQYQVFAAAKSNPWRLSDWLERKYRGEAGHEFTRQALVELARVKALVSR